MPMRLQRLWVRINYLQDDLEAEKKLNRRHTQQIRYLTDDLAALAARVQDLETKAATQPVRFGGWGG